LSIWVRDKLNCAKALERSLRNLQTKYIDLVNELNPDFSKGLDPNSKKNMI